MPDTSNEPPIDWSKIEMPSGQITMKKVCEVENLFADKRCFAFEDFGNLEINYILEAERRLAVRAYCKAGGIRQPDDRGSYMTRRGWLMELNNRYQAYGISTGMQVTNQVVRRLEESAAHLAREQLGKTP